MDVLDRANTDIDAADTPDARDRRADAALWSAIAADNRALDERTARLRAMRVIHGDDETA